MAKPKPYHTVIMKRHAWSAWLAYAGHHDAAIAQGMCDPEFTRRFYDAKVITTHNSKQATIDAKLAEMNHKEGH
jgi:hypothetical protein